MGDKILGCKAQFSGAKLIKNFQVKIVFEFYGWKIK